MPDAKEVIEVLESLQSELKTLLQTDLLDVNAEKFERWYRRALAQLKAWRFTEEADGFEYASYTYTHDEQKNLYRQGTARAAVLKALSEDILAHPVFYEARCAPPSQNRSLGLRIEPEKAPTSNPDQVSARKPERVFLGHGRSSLFAKVQIHLENERHLKVEAFESQSHAGHSVVDVLKGFLDACTFAVLVVTGEDETTDGALRARQNVVHEIGLFQGRLGFEKVALLEQEGVETFSNIAGLQTIRFTGQDIQGAFYELERMLRREGVIK
jgi:predicted nucleotide-binding protein